MIRDFPLESIHKQAFKAHEAASCAGEQGKYLEMVTQLFANQKALELKDFPDHAKALGLDLSAFEQCLNSGRHAAEIRQDMADGSRAGVKGTPTFLLGFTQPNDSVKALTIIRGAQPYAQFKKAIDALLASQKD